MKYPFTSIVIIFNPNSTGPSRQNARDLQKQLRKELPKSVTIETLGTKNVGHAEDIGADYAKRDTKTLLISSSGDGGYNELINGVLRYTTKNIVVTVLPSGNANDHHHATSGESLFERIVAGKTRNIDVLRLETTRERKAWQRYAHSYIGAGLTAYIGEKLTKADLNPVNEKWMVAKYLLRFRSVKLKLENTKEYHRYSNLIAANIDRMSKVIQLSENTEITDGEFELYLTPRQSIWQTLRVLLRGAAMGLVPLKRTKSFRFQTGPKPLDIQLDGEVFTVDNDAPVTITSVKRRLKTLA